MLDARRLGALDARVTVAVDSAGDVEAAARGGVREVLIDVNVGLPRCGCAPERAGALADLARRRGLVVRGVMGYEGHAMLQADRAERARADRRRACSASPPRIATSAATSSRPAAPAATT